MASPFPTSPELVDAEPLSRRAVRPGGVEDRYRSLFVIGRGGMGTVEVALERGKEDFERIVALKRLLPEGARDARHKEMFLREARLAALLAHPNVVHVFGFGDLYGELFMAMEYVEGEPLSHVLRASREVDRELAPALVAFVLAQVCDGLHAAHELRDEGGHGQPLLVVHRDVSPHNVMIAYEGRVKLLDFGVAKFEMGGNESRTGEVKGKMAYMSPEQALGEKLDRRSDLFSVGAVLFECLTGGRMWGGGTDLEVMRRLALESPPRLDVAMPNAPRALVDLHARLIARDPEKRPATARDVAEELRAFATSTSPCPDLQGVRGLMNDLFGPQAEDRRALLTESLEQVAPARVECLRQTLEPQAFLHPTSMEPLIVQEPPPRPQPKKARAGLILGIPLAFLLVAVMASSIATRSLAPPRATVTPPPPATPTPTPTATPTAMPSSPTPTRTTAPLPTSAHPPIPSATPPPSPPPRLRAPTPVPSPTPAKLPDVDPTPF
jgi:serine/threonine protein kinase